jgi:hypothetical protein
MDLKKMNAGRLRAMGYDKRKRLLQVQLDDGSTLQYSAVGEEIWHRFSGSTTAWSYYRDNIVDEFTVLRLGSNTSTGKNPLDDLFQVPPESV